MVLPTIEEREDVRLQKDRARRKRHYWRHIADPKKTHAVPAYLPLDLLERMDCLLSLDEEGKSRSRFICLALEHYMDRLENRGVALGVWGDPDGLE